MTKLRIPVVRFSDGRITAHASPNLINGELVLNDEDALNAVIVPESIPVGIWWVEVDVPDTAPSLNTPIPCWRLESFKGVADAVKQGIPIPLPGAIDSTSQSVSSATTCQHCSVPAGAIHHKGCPNEVILTPTPFKLTPRSAPFGGFRFDPSHVVLTGHNGRQCSRCGVTEQDGRAEVPCLLAWGEARSTLKEALSASEQQGRAGYFNIRPAAVEVPIAEAPPPFHVPHQPHDNHGFTDYCGSCGALAESETARNPCKKAHL